MPPTTRTLPQSIAFHIGAHKTATTHIQKTLLKNRDMLLDEGIRVLTPGYLRKQGRTVPSMFDLSWGEIRQRRHSPDEHLKFLAMGCKRLVFSEENFVGVLANKNGKVTLPLYPSAAKRIAELTQVWSPIKQQVFIGVRNPASFLSSAYSQVLLGHSQIRPRAFRFLNDWRNIDWAAYVDGIRSIDGLGEVFVWRYEDYVLAQRLILRRMLRWKVGGKVEILPGRVHQSLSVAAVRQTLQWTKESRIGTFADRARRLHPITDANPAFQLYADGVFAEAEDRYAEQMTRIEGMGGVTVLHPPKAPQLV